MQTPDADGCVHVTWPSKTIPHGGIFHRKVVEPSAERQEYLKVLLQESKMDIEQRKKSAYMLRREEEKKQKPPPQRMSTVRPRTSKRRSLSAIRESGIYECDDDYRPPKRGEDREKLKERLAYAMAYGEAPPPDLKPERDITIVKLKTEKKLPTKKEKWHDLVSQIRERVDWLAEMEALGEAEPHRDIIQDQIAERMRAMDALGVDAASVCSFRSGYSTPHHTARSNASGKSRGSGKLRTSAKSVISANGSIKNGQLETFQSAASPDKAKSTRSSVPSASRQNLEENVSQYKEYLTPLKYSPRRRV